MIKCKRCSLSTYNQDSGRPTKEYEELQSYKDAALREVDLDSTSLPSTTSLSFTDPSVAFALMPSITMPS